MPYSATKFIGDSNVQTISRIASETIVERQLVEINASDFTKVDQCDAANDVPLGVPLSGGAAGDEIRIAVSGQVAVVAGGTIVPGDELVTDNAGKVTARGTTATTKYNCIGRALTGAATGELVMVDIDKFSIWGANAS